MSRREMEGVRVVEYGPRINACYAGKLLADLGAQVVKVESPQGDDAARVFGPFPGDVPDPELSALHLYGNCNKFGVTLSLESPTGRGLFKRLAAWADILIDGTQPGDLDDRGLDFNTLHEVNPRLIVTALSSLGRSGPYGRYRGYELNSWHGSGSSSFYLGDPNREPIQGAWYQASQWGAANVAAAAVMGLHARERTGRGQYVDISEAEALATLFCSIDVSDFYENGNRRVRSGVEMANQAPAGLRLTKEGWIYIMALAPHQWEGLVQAMGSPDWATSELFKGTSRERSPYAEEISHLMTEWVESHTAKELFYLCQSHGTPAAPVHSIQDLLEDEHLAQRGFFVEVDHPKAGRLRLPGAPYKISGDPWRIDRPAPLLGQHNRVVYCDWLGVPASHLADLGRAGVI